MITLQDFNHNDCSRLISEISDARFLLQWAGPKYAYPLDEAQLNETLSRTTGERPDFRMFKAVKPETLETAGHVQLMSMNYDTGSCVLGRVLIFKEYRGNGYGKQMVVAAIRIAFEKFDMNEILLGVFDFNTAAIDLYKKIGFIEYQFIGGARQFQYESWNLVRMRLCRQHTASETNL